MTRRLDSGEAGFGLVELLVALAISSLIVIGIGGLFAFAGQLRDRGDSTTGIQRALLETVAVSSALAEHAGTRLTHATPTGFDVELPPRSADGAELHARIVLAPERLDVQYSGAESSISVNLSPFETVRLEYLSISGQSANWQPTWERLSNPLAVRLLVTKTPWQWPLMLWIADRPDGP